MYLLATSTAMKPSTMPKQVSKSSGTHGDGPFVFNTFSPSPKDTPVSRLLYRIDNPEARNAGTKSTLRPSMASAKAVSFIPLPVR